MQRLVNDGHCKHNIAVMGEGEVQLVVDRRNEVGGGTASQYTVCAYCEKRQLKTNLCGHSKTCRENTQYHDSHPTEDDGKKPRAQAVKQVHYSINNDVYTA